MAVTPIVARCRECGEDFHLFEVRDERSGLCPRCGRMLTADWTATLLDSAVRADAAQRQLVAALRRLHSLPGNVAVRPHSVLRNLFEETGWTRDLAADADLLRDELRELRRLVTAWERLEQNAVAPKRSRRFAGLRARAGASAVSVGSRVTTA